MIAPIDECYALVGAVKVNWEGISGGDAIERAVPTFFERLRQRSREARMSEADRAATGAALRTHGRPEVEADTAERGAPETSAGPASRASRSQVTGVRAIEHAAAPTLASPSAWSDDSGREVFMAGLGVQIQIEPAKRRYDDESKAKLTELFGDPHRWSTTAQRMHWTSESMLVPSFTRHRTAAEIQVLCNYDVELAAAKYFHSVTDGEVPLAFHFNGSVYYSGDEGRLQIVQVPWDTLVDFAMPVVGLEGDDRLLLPLPRLGAGSPRHARRAAAAQGEAGAPTLDAAMTELLAKESFDE